MGFWKKLLGGADRPVRAPFEDSLLGSMIAEDERWVTQLTDGSSGICFELAGDERPFPALLTRAHEISENAAEFEAAVAAFLREQQRVFDERDPEHGYGDEIAALETEKVSLWDPARPLDGMIWFRGQNEFRIWRCDMKDGQLRDLGFDS